MIRRHFLISDNKETIPVIKYTTSDGSIFDMQGILEFWLSLYEQDVPLSLGAYVVSNTYDDIGQITLNTIIDRTGYFEDSLILFPIFTTSILSSDIDITKLTSVELPDTIKHIGDLTFQLCGMLQHVTLHEGLISIDKAAFNYCVSLQNINIPDSTVSIGNNAFADCISLSQVTLGRNLNKIDEYAFSSCSALQSIVFPNSLTYIGTKAFIGCTALTTIYYNGTISEWNNVEKYDSWNERVPATVVHCADGDVTL